MTLTIAEALADVGLPCCHPPYRGKASAYITYSLLGQVGQIYAEGREAETGVMYAVEIFSPGYSAQLLRDVKAALEAAGYIANVEMENYDHDTDRHQMSLTAVIEGAEYGCV